MKRRVDAALTRASTLWVWKATVQGFNNFTTGPNNCCAWKPTALLRQAVRACRKGGVVSVLGVYGLTDKFPMGLITNKSLTLRSAQQHGQRYMPRMFDYVLQGDLDPSVLITHDMPLADAVRGYELFKEKKDGCVRAVFRP